MKQPCKDVKTNFSKIIDYIIFYEDEDMELEAMNLIRKIELRLSDEEEVESLCNDFYQRSEKEKKSIFYGSIYVRLITYDGTKQKLIEKLSKGNNNDILEYINAHYTIKNIHSFSFAQILADI